MLCAAVYADESDDGRPRPGLGQHDVGDTRPNLRLLVLTNGRMVDGQISQNAGGYVVDKPNGSMLVPFDLVRLVAEDREDAYRKMQSLSGPVSASAHIDLARWCLMNQYFDEATSELRRALHLAPDREDARRMLRRLEELTKPASPASSAQSPPDRAADDPDAAESRSLSELPPETAQLFVRRVQPLLMNKCAISGCHGPSAGQGLHLERTRAGSGGRRIATERNLAACLKFIDPSHPEQSPLLTVPQGNHDRGGRPVFHGPTGAEQMTLLREWVRQAARDVNQRSRSDGRKPAFPVTNAPLSGKRTDPVGSGAADSLRTATAQPRSTGEQPATPGSADADESLEALLERHREDAFDPDIFNRRNGRSK